jgi:hypothetical protein
LFFRVTKRNVKRKKERLHTYKIQLMNSSLMKKSLDSFSGRGKGISAISRGFQLLLHNYEESLMIFLL